jgi:CheY-like chemotaxis protein
MGKTSMNVLIAEDEIDIAILYKSLLEARNHKVTLTSNGEECLKTYHEASQRMIFSHTRVTLCFQVPFHAVLLDYKMPQINGMEVAKEILAVNSHQRIIFASAYTEETLLDSVRQLKQAVELIQKPFATKKLIDTLEDKDVYEELLKFNVDIDVVKAFLPTHEQITDLLERLRSVSCTSALSTSQ